MLRFLGFFLMVTMVFSGCSYTVTDSWKDERLNTRRVLQVDTQYEVTGATLVDHTLSLSVGRTCQERQEVSVEQVIVEKREYDTTWAWLGAAGVFLTGVSAAGAMYSTAEFDCPAFPEPGDPECPSDEDLESTYAVVYGTLGLTALISVVALYYMASDGQEERTLSSRNEERQVEQPCRESWPRGSATLMAPSASQQFSGFVAGDGQVDIDVKDARAEVWSGEALQLQFEGARDWIPVHLSSAVLTAGREISGDTLIHLTLSLDDSKSNANGVLDAGEETSLRYEVSNSGASTARELSLAVAGEADGVDIESPIKLNAVAPGEVVTGTLDITASATIATQTLELEGTLFSGSEAIASDRSRVDMVAENDTDRIYIRVDGATKYQGLLEAGTTRVQSVLTGTRRYQFVSDSETKERIEEIVEKGGGNIEERQKSAVEAARQENISKVIQLSVQPIMGSQVQLVLTVHNTVSGDRVFLKDAPADTEDAFQALQVFDELAQAFLDWDN